MTEHKTLTHNETEREGGREGVKQIKVIISYQEKIVVMVLLNSDKHH